MSRTARAIIVPLLFLIGAQAWLIWGDGFWSRNFQISLAAVTLVAASLPPLTRRIMAVIDALRAPSRPALIAVLIGATYGAYIVCSGCYQGRDFRPRFHDEYMLLLQARMLAAGRLWLPEHPLAAFFQAVYVFVKPVYAAQSLPGAALLLAPGLLLHLPYWLVMACLGGTVVGLLYRILVEMADGAIAALAALMLVGAEPFRLASLAALSQVPLLLLGLGMIWAWLRWRRRPGAGPALLFGLFAGCAAITRPADALAYGLPAAIALGAGLLRQPRDIRGRSLSAAALGVLPFAALQIVFNVGVCGTAWRTPVSQYNRTFQPAIGYGFRDPATLPPQPPEGSSAQRGQYVKFILPAARAHRLDHVVEALLQRRLPLLFNATLPHPLLYLFLPLGLLGLTSRARWVLASTLPLWIAIYVPYPVFVYHYTTAATPAIVALLAFGALGGSGTPSTPMGQWAVASGFALAVVLTVTNLPEFNRFSRDEGYTKYHVWTVDRELAKLPRGPAIVLFRDPAASDCGEEFAYNIDAAHPDDQPIIRAHDRGADDSRLFRYYARQQPQRTVYLYDPDTDRVECLGTVAELADANGRPAARHLGTTATSRSARDD